MNRTIILIGLMVFAVAFLFPPFEYVSFINFVLSDSLGTPPSSEITFLPFWHNGDVYRGGDLIGTGAKIATGLWFGLLGGIAFFTFALGAIVRKKKLDENSTS